MFNDNKIAVESAEVKMDLNIALTTLGLDMESGINRKQVNDAY